MASAKFPLIFSFPDMKAVVAFSFPANICMKSLVVIVMVTSA